MENNSVPKFIFRLSRFPVYRVSVLGRFYCNRNAVFSVRLELSCGPGSVVGIATAYGLDGPGIESRGGRDFPHLSRPALRPTQPPV